MISQQAFRVPVVLSRVKLRPLMITDLESLYQIEADPVTKKYVDGPVTASRELWLTKMRGQLSTTHYLGVVARKSGELIGRAALSPRLSFFPENTDLQMRDIRIVIAAEHCGAGKHYGNEIAVALMDIGFRQLDLDCISAEVDPRNMAALKLVQRYGFRETRELSDPGHNPRKRYFRLMAADWFTVDGPVAYKFG